VKFLDIGLHPSIQAGVEENNFVDCTPIQEAAIPPILQGKDVAGLAQTGTGKTAAFLLPLMDRILRARKDDQMPEVAEETSENKSSETTETSESVDTTPKHVAFKGWRKTNFILVLVPTRELCDQVCVTAAKFGKSCGLRAAAIYGGTGYESQKAALRGGVEFIVATPGRLIDLYKENLVDLGQVRAIVFDEADRMFDMGFKDDMKYVLRRVPNDRQFLVFSATLNFDVLNTAYEFGANPIDVNVSRDQAKAENVVDEIFHVGHDEKPKMLLSLLKKNLPKQAIIFSNFKHNVERISKFLSANGVPAMGISSLISQSQRTRIMELFRAENDSNILVATDVAARGLDIKGVDLVINFELPDDAENYVHRIGRTGRAGEKGRAMSLVGDRDVEALSRIETYLGHKVTIGWIDEADIIKEFKEFPRDRSYAERNEGRPGGGGHSRDSRGGGGGFNRDRGAAHNSGPRRDGRPGGGGFNRDRDRGPNGPRPHHGGPAQGGAPHQRNDRPQHAQGPRPQGSAPAHNRGDRPQHPQGPRPQGQHQGPNQRHGQRPHRSGGRPGQQQPRHRDQQGGEHRQSAAAAGGGAKRHYTHRPGEASKSAGARGGGVITKVAGFFKKLFK
jgi:superfamily II DNA/RNA helicase